MSSVAIIVMLELDELCLQIDGCPKQHSIKELSADRANQALHEGMRQRHIGNRLDCGTSYYSEVRLPLVESIQRIMIRAEAFRQVVPGDRSFGTSDTMLRR